jgi:hypothetical protein
MITLLASRPLVLMLPYLAKANIVLDSRQLSSAVAPKDGRSATRLTHIDYAQGEEHEHIPGPGTKMTPAEHEYDYA